MVIRDENDTSMKGKRLQRLGESTNQFGPWSVMPNSQGCVIAMVMRKGEMRWESVSVCCKSRGQVVRWKTCFYFTIPLENLEQPKAYMSWSVRKLPQSIHHHSPSTSSTIWKVAGCIAIWLTKLQLTQGTVEITLPAICFHLSVYFYERRLDQDQTLAVTGTWTRKRSWLNLTWSALARN